MDHSAEPLNIDNILSIAGLHYFPIGLYDTPDLTLFQPMVKSRHCIFSAFDNWQKGEYITVSKDHYRCAGAGYWLCGKETRDRKSFVEFLAKDEGLKASSEMMNQWLDNNPPYHGDHANMVIGPLLNSQYEYLKTITFFVDPDQLSLLITGCEYFYPDSRTNPVKVPFGSGCGQLLSLFDDLNQPAAMIGGTDIAMRQFLPPSILSLTVTKPLLKMLCSLDEDSFLYKPFWKRLKKARKMGGIISGDN